ncbi:thiosulfate oxidation carrier complex protein SoxZ [Hyphomicrobium methylovorum]|uniref:thiosulfate oxidation carrier complex protein SoxZ n=1 Tax=Hyphomicrobium methylovorum TaxID=84 RepID=UPI0015E66EFF|nr:thiosulfate oxidation carrier complex protein SoxZ [Hyphomicrobium methylovorum]MBA2126972.1 thiosulfate oxidation carrier complex protein SoxZ [Hyphomicrobium methylovorum]
MASKVTPRVRMPATAKAGEIIEVKTLISHEMESGQRKDAAGKLIPRHIINKFTATFNGQEILSADWHPAISANPYQSFPVRATETGTFVFTWFDDDGSVYKSEHKVEVS